MTEYVTIRYFILSFLSSLTFLIFMAVELLLYDTKTHDYNYALGLFFVFSLITILIFLYIGNVKRHETILYLLYYLSSIATISFDNLLSLVMSFEFMALSAIMIVASNSIGANKKQVIHYSCIHFLAGVLLLVGGTYGGDLRMISEGYDYYYKLFFLMGLLINCACFPLSSWVPDAYSVTLNNGIIILSVFTTKVSAFILLLFFQGESILLFLGIATSIYGIIFAILENNIKRLLCYNLVGQMGLVITAIGFSYNNEVNVYGILVLQIILSVIYQTLLFMVAISVINSTQKFNLNEIGGLFNKMKIEAICSIVAILTMGGLPGTCGFVSKFLITHNIDNASLTSVLISHMFSLCNVLLFVSVGVKFFWFVFISKAIERPVIKKVCVGSRLSILILTIFCIFFGMLGNYYLLYNFDSEKLNSIILQCALIFGSILFFIYFCSIFRRRINFAVDIDWFYRELLMRVALLINDFLLYIYNVFATMLNCILCKNMFLCSKNSKGFLVIQNVGSLSLTIILGMLFIIVMVFVYLCLNL